jgi:hypothetical protein
LGVPGLSTKPRGRFTWGDAALATSVDDADARRVARVLRHRSTGAREPRMKFF